MNRKTTRTLTLCLFLMVVANVAMAQPFPPAPSDGAPLDGFASLLIVAGIAYGGIKLKRNKN
ncbi:MAG: hypothetical protein K9G46_03950 [Flavobacteriales bacterium]|jgi:hypothetical protein|nr:hypothetical protein [Flavobacteriales bacterium]